MCKIFTTRKLKNRPVQKILSMTVSLSLMLAMITLGGQNHTIYAEGPSASEAMLAPDSNTLDTSGSDITKWKWNSTDGCYESQNSGNDQNITVCEMTIDIDVTAPYAELKFDWKTSSEACYDYLTYTLTDKNDQEIVTRVRSGEETDFTPAIIKLIAGNYTLKFSYKGDEGSTTATCMDKGYVKDIKLVTYNGVTEIPKTMFSQTTDLTDSNIFSLATENDGKVGRINFGTRPKDVQYYYDGWEVENARTATAGPMTWLVACHDNAENSGNQGVVLYAEEPMMSAKYLDNGSDSLFQTFSNSITSNSWPIEWGTYSVDAPTEVFANHWGASNLRVQAKNLLSSYFKNSEENLIASSNIKTTDTKNNVKYATTDKLYVPQVKGTYSDENNREITVGETDTIVIDNAYWSGLSWLRSPNPINNFTALHTFPGGYVFTTGLNIHYPAVTAAFKMDLTSVIFASAASATSSVKGSENLSQIEPSTPMTLRLDGTGKINQTSNVEIVSNKEINYKIADRESLVLLVTTPDGATYQYVIPAATQAASGTLNGAELCNLLGVTQFVVKAWVEKNVDDGSQLTYATKPVEGLYSADAEVPAPGTPENPEHTHQYETTVVASTETALGGTHYVCTAGDDEYWDNFTRDNRYAQINMPNGETIYHYCTHNNLATETTVDVGNGQTLRVFLQDPLRVLLKNDTDKLGIVVEYIPEGTERYNELMSQRDPDHEIEHIKFFEVYPTINGTKFSGELDGSVYMEYEIPEGWDEKDLEIILVNAGDDQEFDERVLDIDGVRYLATWKTHFSPYAMIDKLSDEEKAALDEIYSNLTDEEKAELDKTLENLTDEEKAKLNAAKTDDELTYFTISGLGLIMTLALGLMLKTKINKKKSD